MEISIEKAIEEINIWQNMPWNYGIYLSNRKFKEINKLFKYINSGISIDDYFYNGPIYRIHCQHVTLAEAINPEEEYIIGEICPDGSCSVLPKTKYTNKLCSFSADYDFTKNRFL